MSGAEQREYVVIGGLALIDNVMIKTLNEAGTEGRELVTISVTTGTTVDLAAAFCAAR